VEEFHESVGVVGTVEGDWVCKYHCPSLSELWAAMQLALCVNIDNFE